MCVLCLHFGNEQALVSTSKLQPKSFSSLHCSLGYTHKCKLTLSTRKYTDKNVSKAPTIFQKHNRTNVSTKTLQ